MKHFVLTMMLCIFWLCTNAQQLTVTGTVTDANDNPLIGAAVAVEGTQNGVITDFNGNYSIQVGANQTLKFSYVGRRAQYHSCQVTGRSPAG